MPTINYNAALPALGSLSGRSSIDINKWVSELKGNLSSLIRNLFSNSEQGFAYDINDLSTLFQDAAGTIPVTGAGQPVGLVKDKSGRNNHAYQTTSSCRPLLGRHPVGGARNLLTYSGTVTDASWQFSGGTKTGGQLDSDGGYTATRITGPSTGSTAKTVTTPISGALTYTICLKAGVRTSAVLLLRNATTATKFTIGRIDLTTGVITGSGWTSKAKPNGFWECSYTQATGISANDTLYIYYGSTGSTTDATFDIIVDYAQLEVGSVATPYQETTTLLDITERGKADAWYLKYDGVDDFLYTSAIDFTATDKVSLFAGARKLSDASVGTIVELSAIKNSYNGVFALFAPGTSRYPNVTWASKGTVERLNTVANIAAPYSFVATGFGSIVNKVSNLRINGIANANNAGDQGTGNYGNYPLYIGRRGGTALPFNGHIYSLIGIGRLTSDSETIALEKLIAKNVGVTL